MSAHTPGPWFVEHTGQGLRVVHGEPNASGFRDDVRFHAVTGIATDEEKANTRVVAAAPEMLAALKDARHAVCELHAQDVGCPDCPPEHATDEECGLIVKIEAAIAKAERG